MNRILLALGGALALALAVVAGAAPASAADHGDAPLTKANHAEDIADVYAFNDGPNVAFAVTVNPLSMPGVAPTFDAAGLYQIKIDNNGDAVADVTYNVTFGAPASDGTQNVTVLKATGAAADGTSNGGTQLIAGKTTAATADPVVNTKGSVKLFAGLRDDPFFFDLNAFKAGLKFRNPGNDFFLGLNASAIVLSVPPSDFQASGSTAASVWAVTSKGGSVIDRMGRPAIATVFIPADQKDAFNQTRPSEDVAKWKATVVSALTGLGSDPKLADALLPDVLAFDTSKPLHFLNGRALTDDVIDAELQLITGNAAASDNVANDSDFLSAFPYLAAPNTAPAPTPVPVATPPAGPTQGAVATPTRTGLVAPNAGTGDASGGDGVDGWLIAVAVAAGAIVLLGGGALVRSRRQG